MIEVAVIVLMAVALRFIGASVRQESQHAILRIGGAIFCAVAVWLAASACGSWFELWPILLLGFIGGIAHLVKPHPVVGLAQDVAIVLLAAGFSLPPLPLLSTVVLLIAVGSIGVICELAAARLWPRVRIGLFGASTVGCVVAIAAAWSTLPTIPVFAWHRTSPFAMANVGLVPTPHGERVVLNEGATIAWRDIPASQPVGGALLLHGAHRDGSQQPAAHVLRRALVNAGYTVLSVDHPGFGESPMPPPGAAIDAWNPLRGMVAGLQSLRDSVQDGPIVLVGHSMGCIDVLRVIAEDVEVAGALLFGGGINVPPMSARAWSERFHADRQIRESISEPFVAELRGAYYDGDRIAAGVVNMPPVLFTRFGVEHDDVTVAREALLSALPAHLDVWDFHSATHYLNAWRQRGVLVGDVRVARQLSQQISQWIASIATHPTHGEVRDE